MTNDLYGVGPRHGRSHEQGGFDEIPGLVTLVPLSGNPTRDPETPLDGDLLVGFAAGGGFGLLSVGTSSQILGVTSGFPAWISQSLLSATHTDTLAAAVVAGDLIYGNSTPKWARLAKSTDGFVLTLVAGLPAWATAAAGLAVEEEDGSPSLTTDKIVVGAGRVTDLGSSDTFLEVGDDWPLDDLTDLTDGALLTFPTNFVYELGTLRVYYAGLLLRPDVDYTEDTLGETFTLVTFTPAADTELQATYKAVP